jgi:hypothetical protein
VTAKLNEITVANREAKRSGSTRNYKCSIASIVWLLVMSVTEGILASNQTKLSVIWWLWRATLIFPRSQMSVNNIEAKQFQTSLCITVLFRSIHMSRVTGPKIYEFFHTCHRSPGAYTKSSNKSQKCWKRAPKTDFSPLRMCS